MLSELKKAGPVLAVDAGGSLAPREWREDERDQRTAKAWLIARAWALGGIDAMALSASDWQLGRDVIERMAADHQLPVLAANLECDGKRPYPGGAVVERGGLRVGVVGVTDGAVPGCSVTDDVEAARQAFAELGPVDLRVALVPLSGAELKPWEQAGLADLVVDGSGRHLQAPEPFGTGWAYAAGSRTKQLGIVTLETVEGGEGWAPADPLRALRDDVDRLTGRKEAVEKRLAGAKDDEHRERLELQIQHYDKQLNEAKAALEAAKSEERKPAHKLSATTRDLGSEIPDHAETKAMVDEAKAAIDGGGGAIVASVARIAPKGSPYAGSDTCQTCHAAEHAQWSGTPHAHAWQSLVQAGRAMDSECFGCHVTGHGADGGPASPETVGGLHGVQCESCHGPAAAHVANPTLDLTRDPAVETCTGCHDGERDMGRFDHAAYRPKIVHGP